MIAMIIGVFQL